MRVLAFSCLAAALVSLSPTLALAGGSAPARACAGLAPTAGTSVLVLGHFAGGRYVQTADGGRVLDWRDDHTCFTSARACNVWQRDMKVAYRHIEGDRTCLPLR